MDLFLFEVSFLFCFVGGIFLFEFLRFVLDAQEVELFQCHVVHKARVDVNVTLSPIWVYIIWLAWSPFELSEAGVDRS